MNDIFVNTINHLLKIEGYTWIFSGLTFGIFIEIIRFFYNKNHNVISMVLGFIPTAILLTNPFVYLLINYYVNEYYKINLPTYHLITFCVEVLAGYILIFLLFRKYAVQINEFYIKLLKKGYESTTDVREMDKHLPEAIEEYDPENYFDKSQGICLGLMKEKIPIYIPYENWMKTHIDVIGITQFGKGIIICLALYQAIKLFKEPVFIIDPKKDKWAIFVIKKACEIAKLPFYFVDLSPDSPPQLNLINNATPAEIEEIFSAGFGLAEKGKESDVYRIEDRFLAAETANFSLNLKNPTLAELYKYLLEKTPDIHTKNKYFAGSLREISTLDSINSNNGIDINEILEKGGAIYVFGSMSNPRVLKAQKMLVLRIMQLASKRQEAGTELKPVSLFLDEFKYLISNITLQTLGASLGTGLHAILAHQSLHDLRGISADLDADMVKGAVLDNTAIKFCYRQDDPTTAELYAKKSGTIKVQSELKTFESDVGLTMLEQTEKRTQQINRHFIDTNMLLSLPRRCGVLYGMGLAKIVYTSPIKVERDLSLLIPQKYGESTAFKSNAVNNKSEAEEEINVN